MKKQKTVLELENEVAELKLRIMFYKKALADEAKENKDLRVKLHQKIVNPPMVVGH